MCFYSEGTKMKRFIILMCFSFISEKQNNFWEREESSRHRLIPLSKLSGFPGNATCVLQYLICELAALTCPMLTPSLKLKTQTQWCMLQNLKSLRLWIQEWCPFTSSMESAECHRMKMQKRKILRKHTLVSSSHYVSSRLPSSVLCLTSIRVLTIVCGVSVL